MSLRINVTLSSCQVDCPEQEFELHMHMYLKQLALFHNKIGLIGPEAKLGHLSLFMNKKPELPDSCCVAYQKARELAQAAVQGHSTALSISVPCNNH
eukprot:5493667-Lingulodinium_polyedra.AAC.1